MALCSGHRVDNGTMVRGVLLAAPLPYLRVPFGDRTCVVLRTLLRTSGLPVGAFRSRFASASGRSEAQVCNLCDEDERATTQHVLCECPEVYLRGARTREVAAFEREVVRRRAMSPADAATLTTCMRNDSDGMVALLAGTIPAWWDPPLRESLCGWREETQANGTVRRTRITVRGYTSTDDTPNVEVWPVRVAVDRVVLWLLGRLWSRVLAAEERASRMDG